MGSGKSTVGKLVAERLNIPFYDLDQFIENRLDMSISTIFDDKGEIFFRKVEHQLFHEIMNQKDSFVLSLGGGTPCYANNHLLLSGEMRTSIYLNASIDVLSTRLFPERGKRPLIANLNESEFKEYIAKHLFDRSYFYNQADYKMLVNNKTPEVITDEIINVLT